MVDKQMLYTKKVLIYHPTIAPYWIDFFNDLYKNLKASVYLYYENLFEQKFNYDEIKNKFEFHPKYFKKTLKIGKRVIPIGHFKALKEEQPDIVIVGEYGVGFWATVFFRFFCRKKYKVVSICDDSYDLLVNENNLHSKARDIGLKFVDGLILCNQKADEYYQTELGFKNNYVFPIIHKDSIYRANIEKIQKYANQLIKEEELINNRVFLFVGRISPEKNIEYLIQSFIFYHHEFPENKLFLIGNYIDSNRSYYDKLSNIVQFNKAEEYIIFLGRKEGIELKSWLALGQMLILPSVYERFGAVVNEALLLGEQVAVSSKAGSVMLINNRNGIILDIKEKYINFEILSNRIQPIKGKIEMIPNNMPYRYDELMDGLIEWIDDF